MYRCVVSNYLYIQIYILREIFVRSVCAHTHVHMYLEKRLEKENQENNFSKTKRAKSFKKEPDMVAYICNTSTPGG